MKRMLPQKEQGWDHPPVQFCVIFYSFIINTIKFQLRFWFFFSPLSEYTRTFIIKCSLSSILQRTRHKSQETMENVNKAERIVEFFCGFVLLCFLLF